MSRGQMWLALVVLGIGGLIAAVVGLFAFMTITARPLHPGPQEVASVVEGTPAAKWADAVKGAETVVRTEITEQNLPGVSVAVGVDGELVWAEGFGWANLENKVRVTPATRFRTGGISMAFTSFAAGLLLEKQKLSLDDEIQTHVPEFPKKQWPVTLRQLMGHVAGIRGDGGDEEPLLTLCEQTTDGLQRFANDDLRFEPGTQFRYSTYGWILVSAAVDAAAGEPFVDFMRSQVFAPLGMESTSVDSTSDTHRDRATLYYPRFAADNRYGPDLVRTGDYSCFAGAGAYVTTPSDLVRFGMATRLLQPATLATLQTPQKLTTGAETGYGLGWDLETVSLAGQSARMVGHDSEFTIGGTASLTTFPDHRVVVAVMTNTSFANTSSVATRIAEAFVESRRAPARP
jgi:CubicO group peptidase (beta-lactamase class C family)